MKKIFFVAAMFMALSAVAAQSTKVAIMDIVDRNSQVEYNAKLMFSSYLAEALTSIPGYEAYDHPDVGDIIDDYEFQRTGYISANDIRKISKKIGVQQMIIVEASQINARKLFIAVKLLDVQTASTKKTANVTTKTDTRSLRVSAMNIVAQLAGKEEKTETPAAVAQPSDSSKEKSSKKEARQSAKQTEKEQPSTATAKPIKEGNKVIIERISKNEYKYGKQWMTRMEYYKMINDRDLCIPAYQQFQKGKKMELIGWCTLGAGFVTMLTGLCCLADQETHRHTTGFGEDYHSYSYTVISDGGIIACSILAPIGGLSMAAGGALWGLGVKKKDTAYQLYNEHCAAAAKKGAPLTLNLQMSGNGLGLALCF